MGLRYFSFICYSIFYGYVLQIVVCSFVLFLLAIVLSVFFVFCLRILITPLVHCIFKLFLLSTMTHLISFQFKYPGSPAGICVAKSLIFSVVFYRPCLFFCPLSYHCIVNGRRRHGDDRMVVGFTATYAISAYDHWCCEFESRSGLGVQHYVIKFVSDLRQVGCFLRILRFPPPIILTPTI